MAQHDYVLENAAGATFRADINNGLSAIVSQNSGGSEPSTMFAYMMWADTSAGVMKIRNAANTAWISLYDLATGGAVTLDGLTSSIAELNILDGVTATFAELNVLAGITPSTTELNHVNGVTSAIQTQMNLKAAIASQTLTGTPRAPTAAAGTSSTQLATTAFVENKSVLQTKVLDIGDWNMDASSQVDVVHGLTMSKIRGATITIRADIATVAIFGGIAISVTELWLTQATATVITAKRKTSGVFDSTSYDSTSFNRGWIIIFYVN